MLYARQLPDKEREELKRMARQEVGRIGQRAQMILLSARRKTVPEIADLFQVSQATIRFWVERFNTQGPGGLYDEERSGRPPKTTLEVRDTVVELVQDDP